MARPATPTCYFSFRSPYSWLAYHDLCTHHPGLVGRLRWAPFWEPDETSLGLLAAAGGSFPYVPMSKQKSRYVLQDVRRLAAERGLPITWPVDRQPCWEVPHLAYLVAAGQGRGQEFIAAVYRARWLQRRDICQPATVGEIAAELGLDPGRAAAAATDPQLRAEGVTALLAIDRDGVFGVPFFVYGFDKYWGVDRLPAFVQRLAVPTGRAAGRSAAPELVTAAVSSDGGHAGGCG
jgi:2-hydroxychromene-2-carboxylate isomerase